MSSSTSRLSPAWIRACTLRRPRGIRTATGRGLVLSLRDRTSCTSSGSPVGPVRDTVTPASGPATRSSAATTDTTGISARVTVTV